MAKTSESPSSPNRASRRKRIVAVASATLVLAGIGGKVAANSDGDESRPSNQLSLPTLETSTSFTKSDIPKPTLPKLTTTSRPATTTSSSTSTSTTEAPTTTTEAPVTTTTIVATPETSGNPEVMPNPFKNLELVGPPKFQNYEIASFQLLEDAAPEYFAPIKHYIDNNGLKMVYVPDGQGRNIEPTTEPVATINIERIQLDAGVLELAAGNGHEILGHGTLFLKAFNTYQKNHPGANKQQAGMDTKFNEKWMGTNENPYAEDYSLKIQAGIQTKLGDTQANIDYTLSHLSTNQSQSIKPNDLVH